MGWKPPKINIGGKNILNPANIVGAKNAKYVDPLGINTDMRNASVFHRLFNQPAKVRDPAPLVTGGPDRDQISREELNSQNEDLKRKRASRTLFAGGDMAGSLGGTPGASSVLLGGY